MNHRLAESELIFNADGSIYHLHLNPGQVADTVITVGDPDRVEKISRYFDHIEFKVQNREYITHTGTLKNKRITVVSTGVGTGSVDIVLNELDAVVNIDFKERKVKSELKSLDIIRIGTCGGLQDDVPVDAFAFSEHAFGFDASLHFYPHTHSSEEALLLDKLIQHFGPEAHLLHPYVTSSAEKFKDVFKEGFYCGITATCPGFYAAQNRTLRAPPSIPDLMQRLRSFQYENQRIINFEMETAAILGIGKLLNHRCCSLSMIINNRIIQHFSKKPELAIDALIQKALERICKMK